MTLRFKIRDILIATVLVALFVGFFAPELRAWDRNTRLLFTGLGLATAIALMSFTPVWVLLFRLRKRFRRGLSVRVLDYAALVVALLSSLGIIVLIGLAVRWMVVR
jgi:hypothetical protein